MSLLEREDFLKKNFQRKISMENKHIRVDHILISKSSQSFYFLEEKKRGRKRRRGDRNEGQAQ